jgi:hypothetical protein
MNDWEQLDCGSSCHCGLDRHQQLELCRTRQGTLKAQLLLVWYIAYVGGAKHTSLQ